MCRAEVYVTDLPMRNWLCSWLLLWGLVESQAASRPNFSVVELHINDSKLRVELADTPEKTSYGLMHLERLPKSIDGMFFRFPRKQKLSFWMKNTRMPLSIAFISELGEIVDIQDMYPESLMRKDESLRLYQSPVPVRFALELPMGEFSKRGIRVTDRFQLPLP